MVDAACLSQWWPAAFTVDGIGYPSPEHWMMSAKARLFGDELAAERVLAARHPGEAKAEGRKVPGFDEVVWEEHRYDLVVQGNVAQFGSGAFCSLLVPGGGVGRWSADTDPLSSECRRSGSGPVGPYVGVTFWARSRAGRKVRALAWFWLPSSS